MADTATKTLTPEQADDLIGAVGTVRNPSKGPWEGEYVVRGYDLDPADPDKVKSLKMESARREVGVAQMVDGKRRGAALMVPPGQEAGRPVVTPERPFSQAHTVPWRWFTAKADKSDKDAKDAKAEAKPPAPTPSSKDTK